ncbi:uncharacterized protein LOC143837276 [Paroedura picta]|uniref:uncharacterized protein LOC143837007 n=1 Tax=Paroedura picta TaxID=143630 RepID=UPI001014298F
MAEKYPGHSSSATGKPVHGSPCSSSGEPLCPGSSELQPYSRSHVTFPSNQTSWSHVTSPSNQASVMVPVRLDVLLFLLNSAARGAQCALPPAPVQVVQGSPSPCHHGPPAQRAPSGCGCPTACHSLSQPSGTHQYGGDCSSCVGGSGSHGDRPSRDGSGHRRDGRSWPRTSPTGGWKRPQSPVGWQEKPRGERRGRDNGDNWQGRRESFGRSRGDRRPDTGYPASWRSGAQDVRKDGSTFGSNYTSNKRTQERGLRPPWGAPDAKRPMENAKVGWPRDQGTEESTSFPLKPAGGEPVVQEKGEDWETDYEAESIGAAAPGAVASSSRSDVPADLSEAGDCASTAEPPRQRVSPSSLPELASKGQPIAAASAAGQPPAASGTDRSKNGGFVNYLKNLYSDLPKTSSSEGSSDLVIDMDVESSKPEEEEEVPSPEKEAGGEPKSWE